MSNIIKLTSTEANKLLLKNNLDKIKSKKNTELFVLDRNSTIYSYVLVSKEKFESDILKCNVIKFSKLYYKENELEELNSLIKYLIKEVSATKPTLISTRININLLPIIETLKSFGFKPIETLTTLSKDLNKTHNVIENFPELSFADLHDANQCAEISSSAFNFDRFHSDKNIPINLANKIKYDWAKNNCLERADKVFIIKNQKKIIGFNSCLLEENNARIDLIAVRKNYKNKGIGKKLVIASLNYYGSKGIKLMKVGTQSNNLASLNLYYSLGFKDTNQETTLHLWIK